MDGAGTQVYTPLDNPTQLDENLTRTIFFVSSQHLTPENVAREEEEEKKEEHRRHQGRKN